MPIALRPRRLAALPLSLLLAFAAGCSSESDQPEVPLHAMPEFPPSLAGTENFADGQLAVQVTLGLPTGHSGKADKEGKADSGAGGGTHAGRHGGGHGRGGMGGGEGQSSGMEGSGSPDSSVRSEGGESSGARGPQPMASNQPPAQLKLHFQNTSATDAISCEVLDFKSALGDFAVFPAKYQIAAGSSAASEVMTSRLGVTSPEIPVTVVLRLGDRVEKKIVVLRLLPPPKEDAPPAPAAK